MLGSVTPRFNRTREGLAMMPEKIHPHFERIERTDPITGHTLSDVEGHPWVQEGDAEEGVRIYFESEESRRTYEGIPTEHPEQDLGRTLSNDQEEGYDEG
jgi:hypothetical protein